LRAQHEAFKISALTLREFALVGAFFLAIFLAQIFATRSRNLFTHPIWLDETLTWTIANDPSFSHAMSAVRSGVETNPPRMPASAASRFTSATGRGNSRRTMRRIR